MNWSVVAMQILAVWLGWFVYLEITRPPRPVSVREVRFYVVEESRGFFNESRYTVLVGNELWRVENVNVQVGREYRALAEQAEFARDDENSFVRYLRSSGIRGEMKVQTESLLINRHCDWICRVLSTIRESRYRAGRKSQEFACRTGYELWSGLYYTAVTCSDVSSLVTGLTYGDVSGLSQETKEVVRKFGLSHLVAVSGFQVVLVAGFLEVWLRRGRIGFKKRVALTLLGLTSLGLFTGLQPPIIRSLLSTLVILLARVLGRRCSQQRALAYSAGIMLFFNPFYVFSVSFRLSCLATWALLQTRFARGSWNYVLTPVNAFLYTLPVILGFAEGVSPVGIVANVVLAGVVPVVTYLCILGFVPGVGGLFLGAANLLLLMTLNLLSDLAPLVTLVEIDPMSWRETGMYYATLQSVNWLLRRVLNTQKKSSEEEE